MSNIISDQQTIISDQNNKFQTVGKMTDMKRRLEAFESFDGCARGAGEDVVKFLARWEAAWSKCKQTGANASLHPTKTKTKTKDILVKMQPSYHQLLHNPHPTAHQLHPKSVLGFRFSDWRGGGGLEAGAQHGFA